MRKNQAFWKALGERGRRGTGLKASYMQVFNTGFTTYSAMGHYVSPFVFLGLSFIFYVAKNPTL
jgi:hypothetical protein